MDSRHRLLDELFTKFSQPIELAKSIQIVNSIRKIPHLSQIQLRVSLLTYRDVHLERRLAALGGEPDFLLKAVEVYRDCLYDTMVLYTAVFPREDSLAAGRMGLVGEKAVSGFFL